MQSRVEVARVRELKDGATKAVGVGERTVLLLGVGGGLYAVDDECTHRGCSLSEGYLEGEMLECDCHGSVFNVKTGEVQEGPAQRPVPVYRVQIEGDRVYIASP